MKKGLYIFREPKDFDKNIRETCEEIYVKKLKSQMKWKF